MLESVNKVKKKYYPQKFFEESIYEPKKIKMNNFIDNDLEKKSSGEYNSESDNDPNDETESDDDEKDNDGSNE